MSSLCLRNYQSSCLCVCGRRIPHCPPVAAGGKACGHRRQPGSGIDCAAVMQTIGWSSASSPVPDPFRATIDAADWRGGRTLPAMTPELVLIIERLSPPPTLLTHHTPPHTLQSQASLIQQSMPLDFNQSSSQEEQRKRKRRGRAERKEGGEEVDDEGGGGL